MELKIEYMALEKLKPYEKNARKHQEADLSTIKASISEFGMSDPIGVWGKDNIIVEGHGRYLACKELGIDEVPVIHLDHLTDEQRRAYALAHNKTAEMSEWDFDLLGDELADIFDIDMTDFGFEDMTVEEEVEVIEDEVPEVPTEPKAKLGDIYQLGNHRLMCGDSTNITDVEKLLDGNKIDMIFTDPPYNVAFNGRSGDFEVIKNDNLSDDEFSNFIDETINTIKAVNAPIYYIWCNWKFYGILQGKLDYKSCIVWAKNVFGLGKGYRHQHEFCLFNGTIDENIKNESDLWEIAKDSNYVHPTQKPVALSCRAFKNHKDATNVLDLFGGSGSTLIGAEQSNRNAFVMELDEKYVDVIIERWENFTGQKAVLLDGND